MQVMQHELICLTLLDPDDLDLFVRADQVKAVEDRDKESGGGSQVWLVGSPKHDGWYVVESAEQVAAAIAKATIISDAG